MDQDLAEAHTALGNIQFGYHWNRAEGEREFRRAFELNPHSSDAHLGYALLLIAKGRPGDATRQLREAQEIEPVSALISAQTEWALLWDGKYRETIAQAQHTLELDSQPDSHRMMGLAYLNLRETRTALSELKKARDSNPSCPNETAYVYGLARAGRKSEARRVLGDFIRRSRGKYVAPYYIVIAYGALGEREQALRWLQRAYREKDGDIVWAASDPTMAGLLKDPRFKAILAEAGLL